MKIIHSIIVLTILTVSQSSYVNQEKDCESHQEIVCNPVAKPQTKTFYEKVCEKLPEEDCVIKYTTVYDEKIEKKCHHVPKKMCHNVTKTNCEIIKKPVRPDVTKKECKTENKQVVSCFGLMPQ